MQMAEQFDISTLAWVKGEIDETLKQARIALEAYVEDPDEEAQLQSCIEYIHQVSGTLKMVELLGAALFAEEVEKFAVALQQSEIEDTEQGYELLMRAILQLPDYLESLLEGKSDNPVALLPLLNELRQLRGDQAIDSTQFFRPNLAVKPPTPKQRPAEGVTSQAAAKKLHRFYLAALAKLLKGNDVPANLKTVATVIEKLNAVAESDNWRRLLWVSSAFIEALRDNSLELNRETKPLLGKMEQQIKQVAAKGEDDLVVDTAAKLLQGMLYQIAHSEASGKHAAAVRLAFDLERFMPGGDIGLGGLNAELKQTVSSDIMDELTRVKDNFDIFVRSDRKNVDGLNVLADSLANIAETLSLLQEDSLRQSLQEQVSVIRQLVNGEVDTSDDTLMGVAGAILAVESALRDWGSTAPVVEADAVDEQVDDTANSPQIMAEHQRVTRQVMKEAKDDLIRVREAINTFLEKPQEKSLLEPLPEMLHNIIGSLTMLSYKRVGQVLASTRGFIENELINVDTVPEQEKLDALADAVMSVEYYLEAFVQSRVHPSSVLDVAESAVGLLGYPIGTVKEEVAESQPDEESPEVGGIEVFEAKEESPAAEDEAQAIVDEASEEIEFDHELPDFDEEVAEQPEATAEDEQPEPQATEHVVPESEPKAPVAATPEVDDEILEIFIEEAEEELENIRRLLPAWSSNPADQESLKDLRRSFHTLKGSGRLVGALEVGEFAWAFENMLNKVIEGTVTHSATMFDLLDQALEALPELIEQFRSGSAPQCDVEMLREMAFEIVAPGGLKLPEDKAPDSDKAAAAAQAQEPAAAEEEKPAEDIPQLDPVLLDIYSKEAEGHIQEIENYIYAWREGGSHKVTEPLIRALHTLQGSSRMAGVTSVADVCASLEKYAKALQATHQSLGENGIDALEACLNYAKAMLKFLIEGEGQFPDGDAAQQLADNVYAEVQHLEETANAQPEAGLAAREEPEPLAEEEAAPVEAEAAAEVPEESVQEEQAAAVAAVSEEAPAAEPAPEPMAVEEEYDPELLEIFLEEGTDILDASEQTLQDWVNNPDDRALVESLQRQLHTLKGGARMAGIKPIGDLSHSLESTFEAVVEGRVQRSKPMMDLLQLSHDRLVTMLEQVRNHEPVVTGDDLIHQVDVLARGGEVEAVPQPAEVPAQEAEEQKAPQAEPAQHGELDEVESAVAEVELNLSNWLRDIDDQNSFETLHNNVIALTEKCDKAPVDELSQVANALQKLLASIMDGHVPASKKSSDLMSMAMERLRLVINQHKQGQTPEGSQFLVNDIDDLITHSLVEEAADAAVVQEEEEPAPEPQPEPEKKPVSKQEKQPSPEAENKRRGPRIAHEMVRVRADLLDNLVNFAGEVSIYRSRVEQQIGSFSSNIDEMDQTVARLREQVRQVEIENEAQIESRREEAQKLGYEDFDPLEFDRFTHMQQLSRSMAESLNDLLSIEDILTGLTRETETLLLQQSRVNTELQESLVHTRMVPLVENAPRLRRIVRQTASEVGKRTTLNFEGAEVEMDRNVVERMMAPLEHMLRNSIAHGIEDKTTRKKAGKPEEGHITIALSREGSEIVMRVSDDGGGINIDAVKEKAIERGLMKPDAKLSNKEISSFILESGFSTAQSLSQIAGRGVGMDVVNSEIKQLGGVMDIDTVPGEGTTFTIRIPLTLSVSRALLVQVGEDTYAIPLLSISGIERIDATELEHLLATENPTFNWVGEDYDLMHLTNVLGVGQGTVSSEMSKQPLLLARSGEHRIAFAVDNLYGSREIVVKSLGPQLSTLQDLAGATILADGSVALIIDMPSLIRRGLARKSQMGVGEAITATEVEKEPLVMVVDDSITVRKVTERLLKRHNMRCITAKDGVDALSVLEESIPDVMLLDIEMPRMDGFELATHIRNTDRLKEIPIIMITSRTGEKHRQRAMDIGVNIYMGKPYTEVDLLENIETLMKV